MSGRTWRVYRDRFPLQPLELGSVVADDFDAAVVEARIQFGEPVLVDRVPLAGALKPSTLKPRAELAERRTREPRSATRNTTKRRDLGGKVPTEHEEQAALIRWAAHYVVREPDVGLLVAIPNAGGYTGGYRSNLARVQRMKQEGVRKGFPDLMLPVARGRHHGLFLELKRVTGGAVKPEQNAWHAELRAQGYRVEVCRGWEAARDAILAYLAEQRAIAS